MAKATFFHTIYTFKLNLRFVRQVTSSDKGIMFNPLRRVKLCIERISIFRSATQALIGITAIGLSCVSVHAQNQKQDQERKQDASQKRYLIRDGKPAAIIVTRAEPTHWTTQAVEELNYHLEQAAEVTLPVLTMEQAKRWPEQATWVVIGDAALVKRLDLGAAQTLAPESYRVRTKGRYLIFRGHDVDYGTDSFHRVNTSPATMWAVDYFLDRVMGVRWLWPGEMGTYVPSQKTIAIPKIDTTSRPELEERILRTQITDWYKRIRPMVTHAQRSQLQHQTEQWKHRHLLGSRTEHNFGHSFKNWWKKYHSDHPDYFAKPPTEKRPDGKQSQSAWLEYVRSHGRKEFVKLDVSNSAIDQAIINEWKQAGEPDTWNLSINDGTGYCTCEDCRAMDVPGNYDPVAIWKGEVSLTARYVKFWNRLLGKMRNINPDVGLDVYAYLATSDPPPPSVKIKDGITVMVVSLTYDDKDKWQAWYEAGAKVMFRPNWWHCGAVVPEMPLHRAGKFFRFASNHGMAGFDFDSIIGYWATQGPFYYMIPRLVERPDLSVDDVIDEYTDAFGMAKPAIERYIQYWENFSNKVRYPVAIDLQQQEAPDGLYKQTINKHDLSFGPLGGSWQVIPYIYTDKVIDKGMRILNQADELAAPDHVKVQARIEFLRDGLRLLRKTRDLLRLGYTDLDASQGDKARFKDQREDLMDFARKITPRHVIWAEVFNGEAKKRQAPITVDRAFDR